MSNTSGGGSPSHSFRELAARDPLASIDFQWRQFADFSSNEVIIQAEDFHVYEWGGPYNRNYISFKFENIDKNFSSGFEEKSITALSLTFFGGFDTSFEYSGFGPFDADNVSRNGWPVSLMKNARGFADLTPQSVYATELKLSFDDGTTWNGNLGRYEVVGTELAPVPLPAGVVLLSSAIVGLVGVRRMRHRQPRDICG